MQVQAFEDHWKSLQREIKSWMITEVGEPNQFESVQNRSQRFLEEALELVQATSLTEAQCHQLVAYVFGRPVGDIPQEIGGVAVTFAALTERLGWNAATELRREIVRIHKPEIIDKVRKAIIRKRSDGVGV